MKVRATVCKRTLTTNDLHSVVNHYKNSTLHNDLLFISMLQTGFFGLLRLGEMTFPDNPLLQNWRKVTRWSTVKITDSHYEFLLLGHKADRYFEGNKIIIPTERFSHNPLAHFSKYVASRNRLHLVASPLWLTAAGKIPTRSFFISCLRMFFDSDIAGQSMRAGGATALAKHGVSPAIIQVSGRWASEAFQVYIRKNPTLLQGLVHARTAAATSGKCISSFPHLSSFFYPFRNLFLLVCEKRSRKLIK